MLIVDTNAGEDALYAALVRRVAPNPVTRRRLDVGDEGGCINARGRCAVGDGEDRGDGEGAGGDLQGEIAVGLVELVFSTFHFQSMAIGSTATMSFGFNAVG